MKKPETIKDYIKAETPEAQIALKKVYGIVKKAAPKASERLAWSMPTLDQEGIVITFAAFKKHLSIFPGTDALLHFKKEIGALQTSKGTIQFPYGDAIPAGLITKIVKFRVKNNLAEAKAKLARKK